MAALNLVIWASESPPPPEPDKVNLLDMLFPFVFYLFLMPEDHFCLLNSKGLFT